MNFNRIEDAFAVCNAHLDATGSRGSQLETFLSGYLLVVICAEYEMCLQAIFRARAAKASDQHLTNVLSVWAYTAKNRMKVSDLRGHLKQFDASCVASFDTTAQQQELDAYTSIEADRQKVAHALGSNVSVADLKNWFDESRKVFDSIASALSMTPAEIAALNWP